MGGLGVLFCIGLYLLIAYKVTKAVGSKWLKLVVIMLALLIPTADAVYGRIKLKHMCEAEAGLKVYRVAEHVEGFMATVFLDYWIKEQGYQFIEDRPMNKGLTTRYSKQPDGEIIKQAHMLPQSQYRLREVDSDEKAAYNHHEFSIENIATGEVLATHTWVAFNGGWAERFLAKFSDAGGGNVVRCVNAPNSLEDITKLVNSTLKH